MVRYPIAYVGFMFAAALLIPRVAAAQTSCGGLFPFEDPYSGFLEIDPGRYDLTEEQSSWLCWDGASGTYVERPKSVCTYYRLADCDGEPEANGRLFLGGYHTTQGCSGYGDCATGGGTEIPCSPSVDLGRLPKPAECPTPEDKDDDDRSKCSMPGDLCPCGATAGKGPVMTASGAMFLNPIVDFAVQHPSAGFEWKRYYSTTNVWMETASDLGPGWSHTLSDRLTTDARGATWRREDGHQIRFDCVTPACAQYRPAFSRELRLTKAGNEYEIITRLPAQKLLFGSDGRLKRVLRPGLGVGWIPAVDLLYFDVAATNPTCQVAPNTPGYGQLCLVSLPTANPGTVYDAFRLSYVHSVPPGCQAARDLLTRVTSLSSGRDLVRYDSRPSCDLGGACNPNCLMPALMATTIDPSSPSASPRSIYTYDDADPERPLLAGVESATGSPGVIPYFVERHEYSPPAECTQNWQCVSGSCAGGRCTCPAGFSDCHGTGECVQGRCEGHRRTLRSSTNCESFGGGAYGNCEETLDFTYLRNPAGAPLQTRVVNAETGRDWTASFDWSHRLLGVTAEACGAERSYAWEVIPDAGPPLDARHITAEIEPLPLSAGVERFTTYAFQDGANAAMQPTITVHGDNDQDPLNGSPVDALVEVRTYTPTGALASVTRPSVVDGQGSSTYYDIFDYGDAGPAFPSPADTPALFNQGNISRLLRRRVQIGLAWTGMTWRRDALITDYGWDSRGRLSSLSQSTNPPTKIVKTSYEYYPDNDPAPRRGRVKRILADWDPAAQAYRSAYRIDEYSELGAPTKFGGPVDPAQAESLPLARVSYSPGSEAVLSVIQPDRPADWPSHSWSYNPDGSIATYKDDSHGVLATTYVAGRRTADELFAGEPGASVSLGRTTYDRTATTETMRSSLGAVVKRAQEVRYDHLGNQQAKVRYGTSESSVDGMAIEHRDHLGRLLWEANEEYATGYAADCVLDSQLGCVLPSGDACPQNDDCWNATTKYRYDARGRVSEIWQRVVPGSASSLNLTKSLGYNILGQLTTVEDEVGRVTLYTYDDFGALVGVDDSDFGFSDYGHDAAGRIVSAKTESRGASTAYSYDQTGRLSQVAFGQAPGTWTLTYGNDPSFSRLPECLTGTPRSSTGSWGRLSKVDEVDQAAGTVTTFLNYSLAGALVGYSTSFPGEACSYTALHTANVVNNGLVERVSYPFSGRVVSMPFTGAYPASVTSELGGTTTNVLKSLTFAAGGDLAGYASETAPLTASFSTERRYFLDGAPLAVSASYYSPVGSGGLSFRTAVTARDARGFPTSVVQPNRALARADTLTIDAAGRLTSAENGDPQSGAPFDQSSYSFTTFWPITSAGLWNVIELNDGAVSYIAGTNRIHAVGNKLEYCYGTWDSIIETCLPGASGAGKEGAVRSIFDHDTGELLELEYDAALRLRTAVTSFSQTTYRYDALGRRIQKVVVEVGGVTTETRFAYDGADRLVSEMTKNGAQWSVRDYVWVGSELVAVLDSTLNTAVSPWAVTEGQKFYVVSDLRSAPIALVDTSGLLAWRASYEPMGGATVYSSTNLEALGLPAGDALPGGGGTDDLQRPETAHPYPNSQTRSWLVRKPFGASQYFVDFEQFHTEAAADLVTIKSVNLQTLAGPFSGDLDAFSAGPFSQDVIIGFASDSHASSIPGPFGFVVPRVRAKYGDVSFNIRLPGQYFDSESGLLYNLYRTYDQRTGRYLQGEPALRSPKYAYESAKAGLPVSSYSYAFGNPMHYIDPTGLYGTASCSYYAQQCATYGGKYYCEQAPFWCEQFPKPPDPDPTRDDDYEGWPRCVRQCLQDCDAMEHRNDTQCPSLPDDRKGPWDPRSRSFDCHAACYSWCAIPSTSYEPNLPLRGNPFK